MTAKSKTKIEKQLKRKTNSQIVELIIKSKKNKNWLELASRLSEPAKKRIAINLEEINKIATGNEILVFPGKILSVGEINKKIKISALNFSEKAKQKLINAGCEIIPLSELIEKNKDAKGVNII
jgi:large subunit ribosomal protein L18e